MKKNETSFDNIIAIIPARGGSKGITKKNIKPLLGKPLIAWTIEQAKKSKFVDRIIVSTDDKEIGETGIKYGAEFIERPDALAQDKSPTIDAVFHVLDVLNAQNYSPDLILVLPPTAPLRNAEDIDNAVELFLESNCQAVISVSELNHSPYWGFKIKNNYLKAIFGRKYLEKRRQDLPKIYIPNGAIYISTPANLRKYRSFYTPKIVPYIMPAERSVDIDYETDFILAELLMKYKIV